MSKLAEYRKALIAPVGALITWGWLVVDSAPSGITSHEWMALAAGLASAFGFTYAVTNKPPA